MATKKEREAQKKDKDYLTDKRRRERSAAKQKLYGGMTTRNDPPKKRPIVGFGQSRAGQGALKPFGGTLNTSAPGKLSRTGGVSKPARGNAMRTGGPSNQTLGFNNRPTTLGPFGGSSGGILPFGQTAKSARNISPFGGSIGGRSSASGGPRQYGGAGLVAGAGAAVGGVSASRGRNVGGGPEFWDEAFNQEGVSRHGRLAPPSLSRPAAAEAPIDNTQYTKTLQDFLAQAREIMASQQAAQESMFSSQESSLRGNAGAATGNIEKGYGALSSFIQGNDPKLQQMFQGAVGNVGEITQDTTQTIQGANSAAQAQQQAILSRLGIQDANIPIANTGQTMEQDMANAVSDVAQRGQLTSNELTSNMGTERAYNTAAGTAAGLEGRSQQDRIQRDLVSQLAAVQSQRQAAQSSSQSDAYSLAMDLMNQDYQQFQGNYDRRYGAQKDAMGFAQQMAEQQARQAESAQKAGRAPQMDSTGYRSLGPLGQANYALQQSGVDPSQAAIITRAIEQAGQQNGIRDVNSFIRLVQESGGVDPRNRIDAANAAAIYYQYFG